MLTQTKSSDEPVKAQAAPSRAHGSNYQAPALQPGIGFSGAQQFAGNLAVQRLFNAGALQAKLSVSHPDDPYEQEADGVADQIMRVPEPQSQRACACGGSCPKCQTEQLDQKELQTKRVGSRDLGQPEIPATVHDVLRSTGQPLDSTTREAMEQRFGYDFSQVQVHTSTVAQESARDVNAHAYTVGRNIIFGAGQFAPATRQGQHLIAHELAHVVQQRQGSNELQRWAYCTPARLSLQDCPPREPGEVQRAHSGPMLFLPVSENDPMGGEKGVLVANFDIGSAAIKSNLHETIYWKQFLNTVAVDRSQWKLLGFTDCQGGEGLNRKLREDRAAAVFKILPAQVKSQIVSQEGAVIDDCITENSNSADRTLNRSVALILITSFADVEPETVEVKNPAEKPATEDCDKSQRDALAQAYPLAKRMVRAALGELDDPNLMKKYFGKDALAHQFHIRRNFTAMKDGLDSGPTFECEEADTYLCKGSEAYVIGVVGEHIHLCTPAFNKGIDFLARTIVHESAHRFAWVFFPDELCAGGCDSSMDTTDAEDNADSYGEFAGDAFAKSS